MPEDNAKNSILLQGDLLQIGFHGVGKAPYPEDVFAPAVLRAIAQQLKVNLQTDGIFWGDYCYFAGITGEAFRFLKFGEFSEDNTGVLLVDSYGNMTKEEMYGHGFDAAGLDADVYSKQNLPEKDALQRMITESLANRQTPVIGLGVFGPPEPFLITGYADGGEAILGWSHFQGEKKDNSSITFESSGQFKLINWYEAVDGIAIVKGAKDRPPVRDIYLDALKRGLGEIQVAGKLGTYAMERWAEQLEDDTRYEGYADSQWERAQSDHGGMAGDLAERRALASSFLELARRHLPEVAEELEMAGTAFQGIHDTVYEIWETAAKAGPFDPDLGKFKDSGVRRTIAGLVRRIAQLDRRGAKFVERAINAVEGKTPGPKIEADPILDGVAVLTMANSWEPGDFLPAQKNIALPHQMSMLQAFLGKSVGSLNETEQANAKIEYSLWMGFSGAAFCMFFDGPGRWNLPLVFDVLGYDYELWMSGQLAEETGLPCRTWGWDDNLRRRIFWNLRDQKLPVLLFNWGEWPDWRLITAAQHWGSFRGYGGREPLDHPANPLQKIDLFEGMKGYQTWIVNILAKRSARRPPMEELYRRAVTWGAQKMKQQNMGLLSGNGEEIVSSRPYTDWAAMLRTDALFPSDDIVRLKKRRDWLKVREVELAERRSHGAEFLQCAAERLEEPNLAKAGEHFRSIHELTNQLWEILGGVDAPEAYLKLADRNTREAIADLLVKIGGEDEQAAKLLESDATG